MQLDRTIITQAQQIPWFENCGKTLPSVLNHVQQASDETHAMTLFKSDDWFDAIIEAQGDLTGYLAKTDYDTYGVNWNKLAKEANGLLEGAIQESLLESLHQRGWDEEMAKPIIVNLSCAVLEHSFRAGSKFRKAPIFFDLVLRIYKAGHLPCGWNGKISQWPNGAIIAY